MPDTLLTLNRGSSSMKFALFQLLPDGLKRLLGGKVVNLDGNAPEGAAHDTSGNLIWEHRWTGPECPSEIQLLDKLLEFVTGHSGTASLAAIGHRIVHGGTELIAPTRLDSGVMEKLEALCPFAPLHQPHNLSAVRALAQMRPGLPQIGCFDTAFHAGQDAMLTRIALPRSLTEQTGLRRFGFHGLSYEYITGRLRELNPAKAAGRTIIAHLGAGASLCAVHNGRSIETTMGFSVLDGLVMATRCGALDPGVILYLARQRGMAISEIEDILYHHSGLAGLSGIGGDMQVLLASENPCAREALDLYIWRIAREAGALTSTLAGLDNFVFTAGVGENASAIRAAVCARLAWLGIEADEAANLSAGPCISTPSSRVSVWVIPTDEEQVIARGTLACLRGPAVQHIHLEGRP